MRSRSQAQADVVVERDALRDPRRRREIRMTLYRALQGLGYVDSVDRFVVDPPDGPYRDSSYQVLDTDQQAIVRIIGHVTPMPRTLDNGGAPEHHA